MQRGFHLIVYTALLAISSGMSMAAEHFHLRKHSQGGGTGRQDLRLAPGTAKALTADDYILQRIPLPAGYFGGQAIEINNRRTVSGNLFHANGIDTFTWQIGESAKIIKKPSTIITAVSAITDSGVLFGSWGSINEQVAGFHHPASGRWIELPPFPGKNINIGQKANNAGRAVGYACNGDWFTPIDCIVWVWNGKQYETPPLPSGLFAILNGINEAGQAVGAYLVQPPFDYKSFLLDGNTSTDLLPNVDSSAYDLNNSGAVVLNFEVDPNMLFVPAVLQKGNLALLPLHPGAFGTTYLGLNDRGDFSGLAYDDLVQPPYPVIALKK